jgi:hypothetical protein
MKIFAEKEAENFLKKEKFDVVESVFIKEKSELENILNNLNFPIVMKVSGEKILHKNAIGGVKVGINSPEEVEKTFDFLMKIKDSEGIIIQEQKSGREFLLGIKSTNEFGHVIAFGIGGSNVEKIKKVGFRVCPLDKKEIRKLMREIAPDLEKENKKIIEKNIEKVCLLSKKHSDIKELDINPLMTEKGKAIVVDARIFFE